mgnify:CR=1 FL=1
MLAAMFADIFNTEERLRNFGTLATFVVFGIIFAESGLMIGFFLPGDSLLFTAGLLSVSNTHLAPLPVLIVGCAIAAIAGDQVGYAFGKKVGPPLFSRPDSRLFKQKHLQQAEAFFDRHGSKTIILARFTPIVRTFAPVAAGIGHMNWRKYSLYNLIGAVLLSGSFLAIIRRIATRSDDEASLVKALFPQDAVRRHFLRAVGKGTAMAAIASVLPTASLQAMAEEAAPLEKKELKIGFIPITCATPLLMADPHAGVVAAVHAGRRGARRELRCDHGGVRHGRAADQRPRRAHRPAAPHRRPGLRARHAHYRAARGAVAAHRSAQ